jgi:uncharacterized repeat protein (TIGR01451 family)
VRYILAAFLLVVAALASVGGAPAQAASGPDVSVSIVVRFNPLNFGSDETYTATVTNVGSAGASDILLTDTLPGTTMTYLSSTTSQGICSAVGRSVTCIFGFVAAGASASAAITVSQSEPIGSTITNTMAAQITDANGNPVADPTPADDSASISIPVVSDTPPVTTDVQVTGSTNQGGPKAGSSFVLTWQVRNNQDPVPGQVTFTDTLPGNLTLAGPVTTNLGTCSSSGATVTCTVDNLNKSEQQVITMNVTAGPVLGNVSDTGSVSFTGNDDNPANNSFTVTVKVQ